MGDFQEEVKANEWPAPANAPELEREPGVVPTMGDARDWTMIRDAFGKDKYTQVELSPYQKQIPNPDWNPKDKTSPRQIPKSRLPSAAGPGGRPRGLRRDQGAVAAALGRPAHRKEVHRRAKQEWLGRGREKYDEKRARELEETQRPAREAADREALRTYEE